MTTTTRLASAPSNWNVANALTALRIALVPLFVWLLLYDQGASTLWRCAAAVTFAVAIVTDRIDGELARNWDLVTDFGKIADPIADKALIGAALIGLSLLGELWWVVTVVILVRELGITLMRFVMIRHGFVMPAGRGGKAKTALQALAILLYVAPLPMAVHPLAVVAMVAAVLLTVVSGIDYLVQAVRLREGSERTLRKRANGSATGPV